jgi:hypothetical protein
MAAGAAAEAKRIAGELEGEIAALTVAYLETFEELPSLLNAANLAMAVRPPYVSLSSDGSSVLPATTIDR